MAGITYLINKVTPQSLDYVIFCLLMDDTTRKNAGFVSCWNNDIQTRLVCPKCYRIKKGRRASSFSSCLSLCRHLVNFHDHDAEIFPTTQQCIAMVENYSIMLQLGMKGVRV